ncbi:MAG: hypothetical protein JWN89_768 [Parcubacteria group bacterium]|nr:hypothetical protein [Parcubacteria group bacterium]
MKNSTAIVLILIAGGLFYTFINPQYTKVKGLRDEANKYDEILSNVSTLTETRDSLLMKYRSMPKVELERLSKVLPDNVDTVKLAMDFDTIAAKYGISIKSIQTGEVKNDTGSNIVQPTAGKPYETVGVTFSFVSSYENFRKFMHDIEQSLRLIDVKSVSFETRGDGGLYEYKVSIQTYWLK